MKKFSEIKGEFSRLVESKTRSHMVLRLFANYMTNNHYIHMSDKGTVMHYDDGGGVTYTTTPLAHYAWQVNSYKKDILNDAVDRIEKAAMIKSLDLKANTDSTLSSTDALVRGIFGDKGSDFIYIKPSNSFPYTQKRKVMVVLEAKKGLKWLRVKRLSEKEQVLILQKSLESQMKDKKKFMTPSEFGDIIKRIKSEKIFSNQLLVEEFGKLAKAKKIKFDHNDTVWGLLADKVFRAEGILSKAKINNDKELQSAAVWILFDLLVIRRRSNGVQESAEFLTKLGYDAFRDDSNTRKGGILYSDEPAQVGFLHKGAFKVVDVYSQLDLRLYGEDLLEFQRVIKQHGYSIDKKIIDYLTQVMSKPPKAPRRKPKGGSGKIVTDITQYA